MKAKVFTMQTDNFELALVEHDDGTVRVMLRPRDEDAVFRITEVRDASTNGNLIRDPYGAYPVGRNLAVGWKKI